MGFFPMVRRYLWLCLGFLSEHGRWSELADNHLAAEPAPQGVLRASAQVGQQPLPGSCASSGHSGVAGAQRAMRSSVQGTQRKGSELCSWWSLALQQGCLHQAGQSAVFADQSLRRWGCLVLLTGHIFAVECMPAGLPDWGWPALR